MKSNNYILPSYEDCIKLVQHPDNVAFYEMKTIIDGYNVSLFNYNFCYGGLFDNPIPNTHMEAHELRGLIFIFDKDGSYSRHILLRKFFNMNQEVGCDIKTIRENGIVDVYEKIDGSIISFVKFPNGNIYGKSKMSFTSSQAVASTNIFNNDGDIRKFVEYCLNNDIVPIFEYVAPDNRIVLDYDKPELILLRLRCNNTGDYINLDLVNNFSGIKAAKLLEYNNIDELYELSQTQTNIEGWVFSSGGQLVKLKTDWYFSMHSLMTDTISRLNILIQIILDGDIDDLIPKLEEDEVNYVDTVMYIVNSYIYDITKRSREIIDNNFNGDIKSFVEVYKKHELFSFLMAEINHGSLYDTIISTIRKNTNKLDRATAWYSTKHKIYKKDA